MQHGSRNSAGGTGNIHNRLHKTVRTVKGQVAVIEIPPTDVPVTITVKRARKYGGRTTVQANGAKVKVRRSEES